VGPAPDKTPASESKRIQLTFKHGGDALGDLPTLPDLGPEAAELRKILDDGWDYAGFHIDRHGGEERLLGPDAS
jgi:hypothetical protein